MKKLKNLKILVWDVDGTLYKPNPGLLALIEEAQFKILVKKKNISLADAKSLYLPLKKKYKSGTTVLYKEGSGSYQRILLITDKVVTKNFIKKDPRLLKIFSKLSSFRHLILANKTKPATIKLVKWLGLNPKIFEKIFTIEDFGVTKPSLKPFKMVLNYTKLLPKDHLMIGDRVEIDLLPAKKLGMKTCFVWGKSDIADVSIPEIYDIVRVLL